MSRWLSTDLYELHMAAGYLERGMTQDATFSLFVRELPSTRAFAVAVGLEDCLEALEHFGLDESDLLYLRDPLGFSDAQCKALGQLHFSGQVRAVPEGRIVLAGEPLLEVTAPLPEAQVIESLLLNQITYQSAIASKAARCRLAAAGRIELVEFGLRRSHGLEAAMAAARASVICGFSGTSNVAAARRFELDAVGTMAHSFVEAFRDEQTAFAAYARGAHAHPTFLVDTYDTLAGVEVAAKVIADHDLAECAAVRLDSGDLIDLSRRARQLLDAAGLAKVRILVSGDLDENRLEECVRNQAPIDAAGIGTRLDVAADAPYLGTVYKLVEYAGRPVAKRSVGKQTLPGAKQVFRAARLSDTLSLRSEPVPAGAEPLLDVVMERGKRTSFALDAPSCVRAARRRFERDLGELPDELRSLDVGPASPRLSTELLKLDEAFT
ncbi:MAG: nicotinate phosphoribosyltransferase, partial [Acidimicrobiales bacterium]